MDKPRSELEALNGGEPVPPIRTGESGFVDLDKLRDVYGIVAIISQRRSNGTLTFAVFKEFERDGKMERTGFIPAVLGQAYEDMVARARNRITELEKSSDLPYPVTITRSQVGSR